MLKVAFDYQTFELQAYGGISRYICELAINLARMPECAVEVIAPLHCNNYLRGLALPVKTPSLYVGNLPKFRRITKVVNRYLAPAVLNKVRPDIIHRTYYAADLPKVKGARTVITVHDMIHERYSDQMAHVSDARGKRASVADADHVICISENTRRDLIEFFKIDPAKTSVVYHGFSLTSAIGIERELKRLNREYIIYVGLRWGYKNFSSLLAAYANSRIIRDRFDIVCVGGGPFSSIEKKSIHDAKLREGSVRQLDADDSTLSALYQQAAMLVYPSLYEGFGIPPLEAMSFGCPVVCCNAASMPEVVGDAASYFDPSDTDSLTAAIERVAFDEVFRSELIRRGTERLKLFSWQRCAEQTLDVYQKVLS